MSDLDSIVKLYTTQQHANELYDRHVADISTLCRGNAGGFSLQDIIKVTQILDAMLVLILEGSATFIEPACWLIRTLSKPYSRRVATDELKLPEVLLQLLQTLAKYLQLGIPSQLQACTAEMLAEFSSAYNNRPDVDTAAGLAVTADLQSEQRTYLTHQRLLAASKIAPVTCVALQSAIEGVRPPQQNKDIAGNPAASSLGSTKSSVAGSDETALRSTLLLVVLNFSYSRQLSEQLLMSGILSVLTQLLQDPDNNKTAFQVVEVLWNLLELAPEAASLALSPATQRPRAAVTDAPAAAGMQDAQEQAQQQQIKSADEPPWDNRTLGGTTVADLSVRQSASSAGSRLETGQVDLIPTAGRPISASEMPVSTSRADDDTPMRAATACSQWPGSAVNTPQIPAAQQQQQQQQQQLAYGLVEVLGMLLRQQLADTSSRQAKEARNDTLAVLQHLSNVPSCCIAMAASSIMAVLLSAATTPELQPSSQHVPAGALTKDDGDHEMKLLLWATLGNIAATNNEGLASAGTLMRCMLLVVDESGGTSTFAVGRWSPEQLLALRRTAWSVLHQVAPCSKSDYRNCGGVNTLIRHIANSSMEGSGWSSSSGLDSKPAAPASSSGRSRSTTQHGLSPIGSLSSERSSHSIEPALRLLQRVVAADAAMATAFADAGVLPVLFQLLQSPVCADVLSVRVGVLLALAELCDAAGNSCRDQLRLIEGVGVLLKDCQDILAFNSSTPNLASLSALDCLWRCCIPSSRCRAQFLALDGMDLLLGLLLDGSKYLRPVTLSLLADLLADKRSHPFFIEWHSPLHTTAATLPTIGTAVAGVPNSPSRAPRPDVINAVQLLISIWREQDQARGLTGADGVLTNPSRPLAGLGERTKWRLSDMDGSGGYLHQLQGDKKLQNAKIQAATTQDVLMDKIFACLSELGFEAVSAELPPSDAAVLAFIRQYVKFRQGEVWQDIKAEFEAAGLTPTHEDGLRVVSGIHHSELLANQVADAQRSLLSSITQEQLAAERVIYDAMLVQAAADAKARVYEKDSSKLTMRERLAAKARKEEMLRHSLASSLNSATAAATGSFRSAAPSGDQVKGK